MAKPRAQKAAAPAAADTQAPVDPAGLIPPGLDLSGLSAASTETEPDGEAAASAAPNTVERIAPAVGAPVPAAVLPDPAPAAAVPAQAEAPAPVPSVMRAPGSEAIVGASPPPTLPTTKRVEVKTNTYQVYTNKQLLCTVRAAIDEGDAIAQTIQEYKIRTPEKFQFQAVKI